MKVLSDHNIPKQLRRLIPNHDVRTAREMGWAELENGELISAAELAKFDVMLTGDKNIRHQQNLEGRQPALISLSTNDWNVIKQNPQPEWRRLVGRLRAAFKTLALSESNTDNP